MTDAMIEATTEDIKAIEWQISDEEFAKMTSFAQKALDVAKTDILAITGNKWDQDLAIEPSICKNIQLKAAHRWFVNQRYITSSALGQQIDAMPAYGSSLLPSEITLLEKSFQLGADNRLTGSMRGFNTHNSSYNVPYYPGFPWLENGWGDWRTGTPLEQ